MPKPDLIMEIQDVATSDDPLIAHLQRIGWNLQRVRQLQTEISNYLTIDIFTHKSKPLSYSHMELQNDIQEYLDKKGTT